MPMRIQVHGGWNLACGESRSAVIKFSISISVTIVFLLNFYDNLSSRSGFGSPIASCCDALCPYCLIPSDIARFFINFGEGDVMQLCVEECGLVLLGRRTSVCTVADWLIDYWGWGAGFDQREGTRTLTCGFWNPTANEGWLSSNTFEIKPRDGYNYVSEFLWFFGSFLSSINCMHESSSLNFYFSISCMRVLFPDYSIQKFILMKTPEHSFKILRVVSDDSKHLCSQRRLPYCGAKHVLLVVFVFVSFVLFVS